MWNLTQAAKNIQGSVIGKDVMFTGVATDSRSLCTGDLFVALSGTRFDGHDYIEQAKARGAVAAMVSKAMPNIDLPLLLVEDCYLGLGRLARAWRGQFSVQVVAITGSNGKTTVKEMLAEILRQHVTEAAVLATRGNLNNNIGMPLTLLRLREPHRYAVLEMGMNHPGEIAYLTRIAQPHVALVNNAQSAHLAGLGTVEAVARAKAEIFEGLSADGWAVINADDKNATLMRQLSKGHQTLLFGLDNAAEVSARYQLGVGASEMHINTPHGELDTSLQVPGMHNVRNALAAAAAAIALNIPLAAIAAGLAAFKGVPGRLQRRSGRHGATIIDDTYNANPDSVRAAIAVLAAASGKKILVLGDMGELGENAIAMHAELGTYAKQLGVDRLLTLGELSANAVQSFGEGGMHFERIEELLAEVENLLDSDVTLLVKGSRFMQMERIIKSFET